jgi:hypothetical protein
MRIQKTRKMKRGQTKHRKYKKRQIKYKTSKQRSLKRRQTKKRRSHKIKKLYGGMFNPEEKIVLVAKLREIGFNNDELPEIMEKLDLGSQQFAGDNLRQLISQIEGMSKMDFREWLERQYPFFVEDVETDYESDDY